jgi:hypothetical protein
LLFREQAGVSERCLKRRERGVAVSAQCRSGSLCGLSSVARSTATIIASPRSSRTNINALDHAVDELSTTTVACGLQNCKRNNS